MMFVFCLTRLFRLFGVDALRFAVLIGCRIYVMRRFGMPGVNRTGLWARHWAACARWSGNRKTC